MEDTTATGGNLAALAWCTSVPATCTNPLLPSHIASLFGQYRRSQLMVDLWNGPDLWAFWWRKSGRLNTASRDTQWKSNNLERRKHSPTHTRCAVCLNSKQLTLEANCTVGLLYIPSHTILTLAFCQAGNKLTVHHAIRRVIVKFWYLNAFEQRVEYARYLVLRRMNHQKCSILK